MVRHTDPWPLTAVRRFAAANASLLQRCYAPPRFSRGNCHADHFFVQATPDGWRVTGVLGMEVASGGCPLGDLVVLVLELSRPRFVGLRWWEPWLSAYGEPDLAVIKLLLLANGPDLLHLLAPQSWGGPREVVVRHILQARSWEELLDVTPLVAAATG